jgi:basic amino acid/polyamine antiporter, APA family
LSERPSLPRRIGAFGSGLLSFNGIVGASIFALPAVLLTDWGSFSPFLFLIVGLGALLVIIPFARSAAMFPESGGPATYGLVYGRFAAFELGWIFYVARIAGFGANTNVLVDYVARWWSGVAEGFGRATFIIALWAAFAAINMLGIKRAVRVLGGFTVLKTLPLIVIAVMALIFLGPPPSPEAPSSLDTFEAGFLITFYAFAGFENAVLPAGETRNPRLALPRAIVTTTILTAALYFLVQLAFVTAFTEAPAGSAPLVDLGEVVAGPAGAIVLTLAAISSLLANLLAGTAGTTRITYAMGERGDLPRWFAAVNAKLVSPANSIAFLAVAVALLAVSGSFVWLAVVSTLARMIIYIATIAALPLVQNRPKLTALHWLSGGAGIAICIWGASQATQTAWITLGALAAGGLPLFAIAVRSRRFSG